MRSWCCCGRKVADASTPHGWSQLPGLGTEGECSFEQQSRLPSRPDASIRQHETAGNQTSASINATVALIRCTEKGIPNSQARSNAGDSPRDGAGVEELCFTATAFISISTASGCNHDPSSTGLHLLSVLARGSGIARRAVNGCRAAGVIIAQWSQVHPYSARLQPPQVCMSSLKRRFCGLASAVCLNCTTTL